MEYVVIRGFTDLTNGHKYAIGDRFPYRGFTSKERAEELSSDKNRRGKPVIALKSDAVVEVKKEEAAEKTLTKKDINGMNVANLRKVAEEKNIEGFQEMNGSELKKAIIAELGL